MLALETARDRILERIPGPTIEEIPVSESHGRVLAKSVVAAVELPPFDNSSMDGYAVKATDTANASHERPVRLRLAGRVAAGEAFQGQIAAGTCIRLFTGSPLPSGADGVVMQEDTRVETANPGEVCILERVKPWENVRLKGEDVKRGTLTAAAGESLTIGRLSLLGACGVRSVSVGRQPTIALVATGSELREPGEELAPGQIFESNRLGLAPLVRLAGGTPKIFPIVKDSLAETREALEDAFAQSDAVITSGGVSVGEMDFVKQAFEEAGGQLQFWKVAIKPGRPFVFGQRQQKFLFGLPGNPVSALVTFLLLVRPALLRWQGAKDVELPAHPGVLLEPLVNSGTRRHFMRVRVSVDGKVTSGGTQASHMLSSLAAANGLVDVPPKTTLASGSSVTVLRWD